MRNRFVIIVIALTVILNMAAGGVCATLLAKAGKTACEKTRLSASDIDKSAPGTCRVTPCQAQKGRVFILPDTPSQRSHDDKRGYLSAPAITAGPRTVAATDPLQAGKFVLKMPPSYIPPPLFALHCTYIC